MIALFFIAPSAHGLFDTNVDKARNFIKAGRYSSALFLLEEELKVNQDNAEARYLSGICYLNQGDPDKADQFFSDAMRIKSDYRFVIGEAYKKLANAYLNQGDLRTPYYKKAVHYAPIIKKDIAKYLFKMGKSRASKIQDDLFAPTSRDELFALAIEMDNKMKRKVATYYFKISMGSDDKEALDAFKKAARYHPMYASHYENRIIEFGERFLRKARKLARIPGKEEETEELKKLSGEILGAQVVLVSLPEYRLYDPGEYIFTLKAGEQTDHWIKFAYENSITYSLSSSDYNFYVVFDKGEKIKGGPDVSYPFSDNIRFKIHAVTDQKIITMSVK